MWWGNEFWPTVTENPLSLMQVEMVVQTRAPVLASASVAYMNDICHLVDWVTSNEACKYHHGQQ